VGERVYERLAEAGLPLMGRLSVPTSVKAITPLVVHILVESETRYGRSAADAATFTMKNAPGDGSSNIFHKIAVATSGGIGGFFGLPALAIELPISTTIMLRSVARRS